MISFLHMYMYMYMYMIVFSAYRLLQATLAQAWLRRSRIQRLDAGRDTARDDALRVQRRSRRVRLFRALCVVTRSRRSLHQSRQPRCKHQRGGTDTAGVVRQFGGKTQDHCHTSVPESSHRYVQTWQNPARGTYRRARIQPEVSTDVRESSQR